MENGFWKSGVITIIVVLIVFSPIILKGFYAQSAINFCQKELPRNQDCRITAEPIPLVGENQ